MPELVSGQGDRAVGALVGLAVGDALGMPTQCLSHETIRARYGVLDDFHPGPDDNDISRGMPAGRVTDDTDQAVILGELLVEGGGSVDPNAFAERLLAWEDRMRAAGSRDLLGPSTSKALGLAADGVSPHRTGRWGDTNGAAMRIAPVGVAVPGEPVERLVDAVAGADFVVVLAPLSEGTRGLVGAEVIGRMKEGALLLNAGRGPVVDTGALVVAVRAGRIRAALDVTDPEPLPQDHELWTLDGVFITPHNAGDTPEAEVAAEALARAQILRHRAGLPLEHVVRRGAPAPRAAGRGDA